MTVSFRKAVAHDYRAISEMPSNEEELFLVYSQAKFPLTVKQVSRLVEKRMEPTVMVIDEEAVGFGNFYGYREGRSVVIGNVVVERSLRGKGFGKLLVSHLIDLAFRKYDLPRIKIQVYSRNTDALLLYGDMGFKPCEMEAQRDYKGEGIVLLTLALRRSSVNVAQL